MRRLTNLNEVEQRLQYSYELYIAPRGRRHRERTWTKARAVRALKDDIGYGAVPNWLMAILFNAIWQLIQVYADRTINQIQKP